MNIKSHKAPDAILEAALIFLFKLDRWYKVIWQRNIGSKVYHFSSIFKTYLWLYAIETEYTLFPIAPGTFFERHLGYKAHFKKYKRTEIIPFKWLDKSEIKLETNNKTTQTKNRRLKDTFLKTIVFIRKIFLKFL